MDRKEHYSMGWANVDEVLIFESEQKVRQLREVAWIQNNYYKEVLTETWGKNQNIIMKILDYIGL